jgi:hypothetical protein
MFIELRPVSYIDPDKHLTHADRRDIQYSWLNSISTQLTMKDSEFLTDRLLWDLEEWGLLYRNAYLVDVGEWLKSVSNRVDLAKGEALMTRWRTAVLEAAGVAVMHYSMTILQPAIEEFCAQDKKYLYMSFGKFLKEQATFYRELHRELVLTVSWIAHYPKDTAMTDYQTAHLVDLTTLDGTWLNRKDRVKVLQQLAVNSRRPYALEKAF